MTEKDKKLAFQIYLYLGAIFITSLVVSNLIFQKFFFWYPFGEVEIYGAKLFEISVGLLPYPVTFLITDLISEIYGKEKANQVVKVGIVASLFSMLIIVIANHTEATSYSGINNEVFSKVFGLSPVAVLASMMAYLFAQFVDIKIYHFWKKLTNGKHLWLRNNFSTISSQFIDTLTVILLLCLFEVLPWSMFTGLVISGFIFKLLVALLDTPLLYLFTFLFNKRFKLKQGEEINID